MKFTIPPNKSYVKDIKILQKAIKSRENISFSKFCDGEWAVIKNKPINNKEFWFDPMSSKDQTRRQALINSFRYDNPRYFIGITCTKVFGLETHIEMKKVCGREEQYLTWADIWVNSNYKYYVNNILPLYKDRKVVLFCNKNSDISKLPFRPYVVFPLENNSWDANWFLIEGTKQFISECSEKNMLFLFCCGPFGNILCHSLTEFCEDHTYLDIGSTLNPFLGSSGFDRHYYMGDNYFSNMVGEWDQ